MSHLARAPWFFPFTTQEETTKLLEQQKHPSFLIRMRTSRSDLVLSYRKGAGRNIHHLLMPHEPYSETYSLDQSSSRDLYNLVETFIKGGTIDEGKPTKSIGTRNPDAHPLSVTAAKFNLERLPIG